ncbi:hypothetical protein JW916_11920 [Candidatus Sumerlaeota bacterium]|nr:hypothetical protein [Candidatus Sumerlaeota bacterium]
MTTAWNTFMRVGFSISVTGLVLLMNACAPLRTRTDPLYFGYYLGFMNKTGRDLYEVQACFADRVVASKIQLPKRGKSTEGPETLPIPSEAKAWWWEDGQRRSATVRIEDVPAKSFDGTLYFVFNPNGTVDAKPILSGDIKAYLELAKGLRPEEEYRLGFVNKTGRDLQAVSVFYGDQRVGGTKRVPKVNYAEYLILPIPSQAEVRWCEDDALRSAKVKLEGVVPKGFSQGTIYFVFTNEDTVEAKSIKWRDSEGRKELFDPDTFPKSVKSESLDTLLIPKP